MIHRITIEHLPDKPARKPGASLHTAMTKQVADEAPVQKVSGMSGKADITPCTPCQKKKKRNK